MTHRAHQSHTTFRGPLDRQRRQHETPVAAIAAKAKLNRVIVYAIADPTNPSYAKRARSIADKHFEALASALTVLSGRVVTAREVRTEHDEALSIISRRRKAS